VVIPFALQVGQVRFVGLSQPAAEHVLLSADAIRITGYGPINVRRIISFKINIIVKSIEIQHPPQRAVRAIKMDVGPEV
jgi:hypothetical protein